MIIKIADIPPGGRELHFDLEPQKLNDRVDAARMYQLESGSVPPPPYLFQAQPQSQVKIELEGSAVIVKGFASGQYLSACARCAEETAKKLKVSLDIILKPHTERAKESEVEDLGFGYYDGEQIDCAALAEEYLILGLPFTVYCKDDCRGLCSQCGVNLNSDTCQCAKEGPGDERFAIFRQLKIN